MPSRLQAIHAILELAEQTYRDGDLEVSAYLYARVVRMWEDYDKENSV